MSTSELLCQIYPPAPTYAAADIPDLAGKVMIVTGANTGVGKETVKVLLSHGATVYLAARSAEKGAAAIRELREATGREALFLQLDLADLRSVKAAAAEFIRHAMQREPAACAVQQRVSSRRRAFQARADGRGARGVFAPPVEQLTKDGYDLQFGTNVLGHFYFTQLLMPLLLAAGTARVINTSSSNAYTARVDFDTLADGPARARRGAMALYGQSKLGNAILAAEIARRYGAQGLVSVALNPGNIKSDMQRHMGPVQHWLTDRILHPVALGALTQLWAGTSVEGAGLNGQFLIPWARVRKEPLKEMQDLELGARLWAWLEAQVRDI
ncbi:hypothetical protein HWV62_15339 [Athelia sp. TMB]|nr:hypothetical protein HWV62_15339 [Athelia sp. TMB]